MTASDSGHDDFHLQVLSRSWRWCPRTVTINLSNWSEFTIFSRLSVGRGLDIVVTRGKRAQGSLLFTCRPIDEVGHQFADVGAHRQARGPEAGANQ